MLRCPTLSVPALVLACAWLGVEPAYAAILEGPIANPANNHPYFVLASTDWISSELEAVTLGGHLATVNDAAEQQWIIDTFLSGPNQSRILWNGLSDAAQEGQFVWASGEPFSYSNWRLAEPNISDFGLSENYVAMNSHFAYGTPASKGSWNDELVGGSYFHSSGGPIYPRYGLVEVPEPGSLMLMLCGMAACMFRARQR